MNKAQNTKNITDDQLAEFTDSILNEKTTEVDKNPFTSDPELHALEQTALRLKNSFREDGPSEEVIRRMHKNITTQWQQQESQKNIPFWKNWIPSRQKWQSQRSRQNWNMVFSLATIVTLMVITIPLLQGTNLNQLAASGHDLSVGLLVASGGLILLAIWFFRGKR